MNREELKEIKPKVIAYYKRYKTTKSLPEIAEKFDVKYNTLYRWVNERNINEDTLKKDIERAKKRNSEKLSSIDIKIEEDIFESFKEKCNQKDVSQAEVIREYIENYICKKESDFE